MMLINNGLLYKVNDLLHVHKINFSLDPHSLEAYVSELDKMTAGGYDPKRISYKESVPNYYDKNYSTQYILAVEKNEYGDFVIPLEWFYGKIHKFLSNLITETDLIRDHLLAQMFRFYEDKYTLYNDFILFTLVNSGYKTISKIVGYYGAFPISSNHAIPKRKAMNALELQTNIQILRDITESNDSSRTFNDSITIIPIPMNGNKLVLPFIEKEV